MQGFPQRFSLKADNFVIGGRHIHYAWVTVAAMMRLFSSSFRSSSSILIPRLVDSFGWSYGAVGFGFAQIGLRPFGASENEPIKEVQQGSIAKVRSQVFLKQAQHTSAFWNLIGIHFWGCAGHAIILVYLVAIAEAEGVSKGLAAGAFVTLSVVSTITRFIVPVASEHMGSKGAMGVCFFLQTVPILLLFFSHDPWHFYLFAVLFGIGFGGEMSAFPIINRQYYGSAPIGTTFGWQMMGAGIGMATGALIGGQLRDWTGDFNATMGLSLVLSLIGVFSIMFLPTTKKHLLPDWEQELPQEAQTSEAQTVTAD